MVHKIQLCFLKILWLLDLSGYTGWTLRFYGVLVFSWCITQEGKWEELWRVRDNFPFFCTHIFLWSCRITNVLIEFTTVHTKPRKKKKQSKHNSNHLLQQNSHQGCPWHIMKSYTAPLFQPSRCWKYQISPFLIIMGFNSFSQTFSAFPLPKVPSKSFYVSMLFSTFVCKSQS